MKGYTVLIPMADGHEVRTVEGLAVDGTPDPVQEGFMAEDGRRCGFCIPGMLMTARHLALLRHPAEPLRPRPHPVHRHRRRPGAAGGRAVITGQMLAGLKHAAGIRSIWTTGLDAAAECGRAGGADHRQGAFAAPGGRRRAAVVNSVMDALTPYGVRHADMPLTPANGRMAMHGTPVLTGLAVR